MFYKFIESSCLTQVKIHKMCTQKHCFIITMPSVRIDCQNQIRNTSIFKLGLYSNTRLPFNCIPSVLTLLHIFSLILYLVNIVCTFFTYTIHSLSCCWPHFEISTLLHFALSLCFYVAGAVKECGVRICHRRAS